LIFLIACLGNEVFATKQNYLKGANGAHRVRRRALDSASWAELPLTSPRAFPPAAAYAAAPPAPGPGAVQTPVSHGEPGGSGAPSSGCRAGRPHLEELGVGSGRIQGLKIPDGSRRELDVVALVKAHGRAATKGIERIDAVLAGHDQGAGGMGRCAGVGEEGEGEQAGPGGEPAGGAPPLATRAVGKRRARSGR